MIILSLSQLTFAAEAEKIKYRETGRIDFESILVEGEKKKPEMAVVTGNVGEKDEGVMIMRSDFNESIAAELGVSIVGENE